MEHWTERPLFVGSALGLARALVATAVVGPVEATAARAIPGRTAQTWRRSSRPAGPTALLAAVLVLTFFALALVPVRARASDLGSLTLTPAHEVVRWSGSNTSVNVMGYGSPLAHTCTASTCDVMKLDVEMPAGSFPTAADGVLVSVKWANDVDQWNLYIDGPDGLSAGRGIALVSNAQSVLLPQPKNGVYTIHVVPFQTTRPANRNYAGEARLYSDPQRGIAAGTPLLPRLQTVPPYDFHIGDVPPLPSNPVGWRFTPDGIFPTSCYLDEQADYGSRRCLRFSNNIRNVGAGPIVLRFRYDQIAGHCQMEQEITVTGGDPVDRKAGPCVFHPQHGHFHYQNFAQYLLFAVGADGHPSARPAARSAKVGYCLVDVDDYSFGSAQARPRIYESPTVCVPNSLHTDHPALWDYMGISVGWGDVYTWDLPGQYIDISHVDDGVYELASRANLDGGILESAPGLETGISCIRITGDTVTTIREFPSQSNTAPLPVCST
jgi:hypothetical protein